MQTNEEATVYVKELGIFLTMKVLEDTPAVLSLGKLCDENGYFYEWINGQNHISFKTGVAYNAIRRTSFRSWFLVYQRVLPQNLPSSTSMTPSRQEIDHPTSSSSSSTSPTMTSSTEIDYSDHPPAIVSSESVGRQERETHALLKLQKSC